MRRQRTHSMGISVGTGQNTRGRTHMLTDKAIQAAKPKARPYKLADGEGLTLLVKPTGSKLWRFRYRHEGREKMLGFGSYPDTSAKRARDKRDQAKAGCGGPVNT